MTSVILPVAAEIAQQEQQTASAGAAAPGLFQTVLLLLACVAVIVAAFYTTRLIARKAGASARSRHMEVLDRLSISNDKQILLIRAGNKVHMVGVAGSAINHLATLDGDEAKAFEATQPQTGREMPGVMGDFAARLKASMPFGSNDNKQTTEEKQMKETTKDEAGEETKEAPVKSGLDTLDDMVSRRRKRFGQLEQEQEQQEAAANGGDES